MILSDLANHVCSLVRHEDSESVTKCKEFINTRYKVIWNDALWRESVVQYNGTLAITGVADIANSNNMASGGYYLMPQWVDRVLALRITDGPLSIESRETFMDVTPDIFEQSGNPTNWQILSPCVWMDTTDDTASVYANDSADSGVTVSCTSTSNVGYQSKIDVTLSTSPTVCGSAGVIERLTKPTTNGVVTLRVGSTDVVDMTAAQTCYEPHVRIQVLPKPTANTAFKSLVKKKPLELSSDYDCPEIRGVDNVLMAFAQGDMLQRARQYAKADAVYSQAFSLLEQLKNVNTLQEATRHVYVPEVSSNIYIDHWLGSKY